MRTIKSAGDAVAGVVHWAGVRITEKRLFVLFPGPARLEHRVHAGRSSRHFDDGDAATFIHVEQIVRLFKAPGFDCCVHTSFSSLLLLDKDRPSPKCNRPVGLIIVAPSTFSQVFCSHITSGANSCARERYITAYVGSRWMREGRARLCEAHMALVTTAVCEAEAAVPVRAPGSNAHGQVARLCFFRQGPHTLYLLRQFQRFGRSWQGSLLMVEGSTRK